MPSCRSEFLLNQHPESASLELPGSIWNGESHAVLSNAVQEPRWWTEFVNTQFVENQVVANQVHQVSRITSAGVSVEIPRANEAGTSNIETAFQTTCHQTFGSCQQSFEFNVPANFDIDFELEALSAGPDGSNSKVIQTSTSPVQSDWNPTTSSSALSFDCDPRNKTDRSFTPWSNETFYEESQKKLKCPISRPNPSTCPHCRKIISSKQFRSHVRKCQWHIQHPNQCDACGKVFSILKDVTRHQKYGSCPKRSSAPKRTFVCACGKDYPRKDHLLRHIQTQTSTSEDDKHLAIQVGRSNY